MSFLLLLFILFFVGWMLRDNILRWLLRKSIGHYAQQFDRAAGHRSDAPRERKGGWSNPLKRRKKIDPAVGEYVRFTETVSTATVETDSKSN
ncbi:MAG: hypothetical protein K2M97_00450, partial [Muribaculaceae bacterium]|nr:hypothetical protein [Muribaculaceae bacterium]